MDQTYSNDTGEPDANLIRGEERRHHYEGERCVHCNVNIYDDGIYGPFDCADRAPITYTTETPQA